MRTPFILLLLISLNGFSQWKDYTISVRGDTLNRIDMKGMKQGPWVIHMDELRGEPGYDEQGYFINDKKDGRWVRFSLMGDKIAEENYRWGSLDGKCRYYTRIGELIREENWRAVDPNKTFDTVDVLDVMDPTKVIDRVVVKLEGKTMRHGTWTFYDPEWGTIIRTENWWMDRPAEELQAAANGEELKPLAVSNGKNNTDTVGKKAMVKPQVILDYEKKNSGKKKVKTRDGSTGM